MVQIFFYEETRLQSYLRKTIYTEVSMDSFRPAKVKNYVRVSCLIPNENPKRLPYQGYSLEHKEGGEVMGFVLTVNEKDAEQYDAWEDGYERREIAKGLQAFIFKGGQKWNVPNQKKVIR